MAGTYTLKSQRKSKATQRLRAYEKKTAASTSKKGQTPAQYRASVATQQAATPTQPTSIYTGPSTQFARNPVAQRMQQVVQTSVQPYSVSNVSGSSGNKTPVPLPIELDKVRALLGTGYRTPVSTQLFGAAPQSAKIQEMARALRQDIKLRSQRIDAREQQIFVMQNQLNFKQGELKSYDRFISGNTFTGTPQQFKQYKDTYSDYEKLYNKYAKTAKLHNVDVNTYDKNVQSIKAKKGLKKHIAIVNKVAAKYSAVNLKLSQKLPTVKQAEPVIRQLIRSTVPASNVTIITDKVLKRRDTQKILDFHLGAYESIQQKPLKAAATFATFAVGGVVLKGLSGAAKVLGAGVRTAKVARAIETTALQIYITSSGFKLAESKNAREFGYNTGDIIFNELLPAGLGLKYGVKVVSSIPKNAKIVTKSGLREFTASERAALGKDKVTAKRKAARQQLVTKQKTATKTDDQLIAEFEASQAKFLQDELRLQKEYNSILSQMKEADSAILASRSRTYARSKARSRQPATSAYARAESQKFRNLQVQRERLRTKQLQLETKLKELQESAQKLKQAQKLSQQQKQAAIQKTKTANKTRYKQILKNIQLQKTIARQIASQKQASRTKLKSIQQQRSKVENAIKQLSAQEPIAILKQISDIQNIGKPVSIAKTTVKTAQVTKPRRIPRKKTTTTKTKPAKTVIPKIKSIGTRPKTATKKGKKKTSGLTTTTAINRVATFKDLFG